MPKRYVYSRAALDQFKKTKNETSDKFRGIEIKGDGFYRGQKEIIAMEDIGTQLKSIYSNPEIGFRSLGKFWEYVKENYEGINKKDIKEFLENNETAQIQKPQKENKVNRPIVTSAPNKLWQIDLADVSKYAGLNNNVNFLLVVVDAFSKFAWVVTLNHKTDSDVTNAMREIFEADGAPSSIQHDNGAEFVNRKLKALCDEYKVHQIVSAPYHPRSNGIAERFNRTLKNILAKFMVNFNTQHYIDVLPKLIANYNSQIHGTTKQKPEALAEAADSKEPNDVEAIQKAGDAIKARAVESVKTRNDEPDLKVGDYVRLAQTTNSEIRKNKTFRKRYEKQWSDEIYRIAMINEPKTEYMPREYKVLDYDKGKVLDKKFYRDQLLLIDPAKLIKTIPNAERPEFNKKIFNREKHLKHDVPASRAEAAIEAAVQEAEPEPEPVAEPRRGSRVKKAVDRGAFVFP
jgi:hypothetical protein